MFKQAKTLLAIAAFGLSSNAYAQLLGPDNGYGLDWRNNRTGAEGSDFGTFDIANGPFSVADPYTSINVRGQPLPLIDISSVKGDRASGESTGYAQLVYNFSYSTASQEAFDAALSNGTQVFFTGFSDLGDTDSTGAGVGFFSNGYNSITVLNSNVDELANQQYSCGDFGQSVDGCGVNNFDFGVNVNALANAETRSFSGSVILFARSTNGGDGVLVDRSWALLDPIISLRGQGFNSSLFTLSLSPGIGNGAPLSNVPEPATWAMLISGFGLVGGAMRRRAKAVLA